MDGRTDIQSLQHFIGGKWVDAAGGETFEVLNPLDDSHYAHAAKGTADDVRNAVSAAKDAFTAYKETTPTERERWLLRVAEIMEITGWKASAVKVRAHRARKKLKKHLEELEKGMANE